MKKFKSFLGRTLVGDELLQYRVSAQTEPSPTAVVISHNYTTGALTVALGDWPELVETVEELRREAGL